MSFILTYEKCCFSDKRRARIYFIRLRRTETSFWLPNRKMLFLSEDKKKKGGDPSAPSSTDTLLRLNPHRRMYPPPINRSSDILDFVGLTGGVCKRQERIHRNIADLRLRPIPRS